MNSSLHSVISSICLHMHAYTGPEIEIQPKTPSHLRARVENKNENFRLPEPFSKFYWDSGVNENKNGYRKYRNENDIFIRNWKRKWFQPLPTVFENYRIYAVIYRRYYRILGILPYLKPSPTYIFSAQ